ncbi:BMP family protein [Amphibacillus sp. MSJ-3]|uniref:BMP family lipoprotein n=1 Tax=Amphibacillus sp. MSJ-3 TaxID=2841505 RepID=UPI001C0EFFD1|nr:BMP family protein [Amphibacillus sp. MSJ-3]
MKKKLLLILALFLSTALVLGACGSSDQDDPSEDAGSDEIDNSTGETTDFSVAMVTDIGGIDDKSFNQSSWEGIQAFAETYGLERGTGFDYAQSDSGSDYLPNLNGLVQQDYNLIYGIGYELKAAVEEVAKNFPDTYFGIVDDVVEGDNVVSINFSEEQGSFLVGVVAALATETNQVGFVGGVDSVLIKRFETGFVAGVKSVNPEIEVNIDYAESFADPSRGRAIASTMYSSGVDIIYHASGETGNGVFTEAKDRVKNDPDAGVWVIGVDRDQYEEGQIGDSNVTLTSMIKRVDIAVSDIAVMAMNGEFPGGERLVFGLEDDAIGVADTNEEAFTDEMSQAVDEWMVKILDGDIVVPQTDDELADFLEAL